MSPDPKDGRWPVSRRRFLQALAMLGVVVLAAVTASRSA